MKIAVLGTGIVGTTIGSRLIELGHEVKMGSRSPDNEKAKTWASQHPSKASYGTFRDAAGFSSGIAFNCTHGVASIDALKAAGEENLAGKILVDVANPLDFSKGMPPTLSVCNSDSLGEQIQREFPRLKVVKTLNTMNCFIMVNPGKLPEPHNVFMAGNDAEAKQTVIQLLNNFGWQEAWIVDLGDISKARGLEMFLPLWVNLYGALGHADFNVKIVK